MDTGGSAAAGGFNYQHRVTAWFAARMLAGMAISGVRGLYQGAVLEIVCETGTPVDDCRVIVPDAVLALLQAKRSIILGRAEDSEMAKTASQFVRQHLLPGRAMDRLVLVTTSSASGTVTKHLKRALDRFRKHPEPPLPLSNPRDEKEALDTFLDHVRREWGRHSQDAVEPTEEQLRAFLKCCWVWTLDVEHGMSGEREALDVLRSNVLSEPGQAHSAWDSLLRISAQAAEDKTGFDRHWLESELATNCGIELTGSSEVHAIPRFSEVSAWNAEQLNVHRAVSGQLGAQEDFVLPVYVPRPHDKSIRDYLEYLATGSEPRLLLLRGGSCTGKTRTAYEAVRAALPDWRLAYPKTAEALLALLKGPSVAKESVVWLDDLHHLLDAPVGEDAAVLLRELLQSRCLWR